MGRPKRWQKASEGDGVGVCHLTSWKYFHDFVYDEMLDYGHYIWRGQRCDDWLLMSTLDRLLERLGRAGDKQARIDHLNGFKYAARGRRGPNPPLIATENEWWALGQHHGLATPLLDWTSSPFTAAYFAFEGTKQPQTQRRALFAVNPFVVEERSTELVLQHAGPDRPPILEFVRPLADDNPRLVSQGGLFSRGPDGVDVEKWVKTNFPGERGAILLKFTVPDSDRERCLRSLNRMNINHLSLFPDLSGATRHCNLRVEIDQY